MRAALSTMWAQQERFRGHMDDFARIAAAAGYDAIEPSHSTDREGLETLIRCEVLPLASLHAPTPRERDARGRWNGDLNLAALDEEERRAAITATTRTIDYAAGAGATAVVVHLGACGDRLLPAEVQLRNLHRAGVTSGPQCDRLRAEAAARRAALAVAHLPQAKRSLEELADYGAQRGVAIGLENRLHYHEIPRFDEAAELLAPYPASAAGYWHDVGHSEVLHRLGLVDKRAWLDTNGPRTIGSHLHDVRGILDHRAPSTGDVGWDYIFAGLPATALRTFEIDQHEPEDLLNPALRHLIDNGVMPRPEPNKGPA
jgi:sugar phosphate isomerase/epimerase